MVVRSTAPPQFCAAPRNSLTPHARSLARSGHCKKLAPTYEKVAGHFHRQSPQKVSVGKIDATAEQGLTAPFNIKGYPTLVLYRHGKEPVPYSGQRTFEDLVAWVEKQAKLPGTPAAPVSVTSSRKAGGASASARGAKASSSRAGFASSEQLRASAFSLLTEHDPLTVGVYLFGGALCSAAALMVFICVASEQSRRAGSGGRIARGRVPFARRRRRPLRGRARARATSTVGGERACGGLRLRDASLAVSGTS